MYAEESARRPGNTAWQLRKHLGCQQSMHGTQTSMPQSMMALQQPVHSLAGLEVGPCLQQDALSSAHGGKSTDQLSRMAQASIKTSKVSTSMTNSALQDKTLPARVGSANAQLAASRV